MKKSAALIVRNRDTHCPHCGATEGLVIHHRRNRQMGGSKVLDRPDNLMLICQVWNGAIESSAADANTARDWGHKLSSWDGFDNPVFDNTTKTWWLLDDKGNKQLCDPPLYLL